MFFFETRCIYINYISYYISSCFLWVFVWISSF